ncbi:hypothetical protein C4D60_Mb11t14000 [Musa balbisiana]|uniref:Uncharacterized protein n=1 Tax=Musa balbisiana TaxID=52838 RepID=A0A4S8J4W8_MUSBA|nr:hypothetical protein C4D60_Mb11t14000 [Musa balbisiana]
MEGKIPRAFKMIVIKDHLINPNPTPSPKGALGFFPPTSFGKGPTKRQPNREVKRVLFALAVANSHVISYVAPE